MTLHYLNNLNRRVQFLFTFILVLSAAVCNVSLADEGIKLKLPTPETHQAYLEFLRYDPDVLLEARTVERKINEDLGTVREKVVFRGVQGFLCSGYLEYPIQKDQEKQTDKPCVLLLHGWSGSKESWWKQGGYISGGNVREGLLKAGYAVFAMDAQAHGDRIAVNDYAPINHYQAPGKNSRKGYFSIEEIYTQTVRDYRRALDYLATRTEIDMSKIGLVGYSMGATQSFLLTAVDKRIKCTVSCVVPASSNYKISFIAPENFVSSIDKRPLLMLMGRTDPLCSEENGIALKELLPSDSSKLRFYESGHKLPLDYVPHAVDWIKQHLTQVN